MRIARLAVLAATCITTGCSFWSGVGGGTATPDTAQVRTQLAQLYAVNSAAFMRWDSAAVMDLRAPDFHTVGADGVQRDRAAMASYTRGIMNGIRKWNELRFKIDSLTVVRDTAYAIVSQYLDRMALRPDNQVHRIQTWVTQREIWIRHRGRWLMWRVDNLRDQRRLIDGQPG